MFQSLLWVRASKDFSRPSESLRKTLMRAILCADVGAPGASGQVESAVVCGAMERPEAVRAAANHAPDRRRTAARRVIHAMADYSLRLAVHIPSERASSPMRPSSESPLT